MTKSEKAEEAITVTKLWLDKGKSFPFFGYLLFKLIATENNSIETLGTDGEYLYYNSDYINKISKEELRGVMMHEILHSAYGHIWRVGNRNPILYNLAGDFVINIEIKKLVQNRSDIKLPEGLLYDTKYDGWYTEQVYEDLKRNTKKCKKCGIKYIELGNEKDNGKDDGKKCKHEGCGNSKLWNKKSKKEQDNLKKDWERSVKIAAENHGKKQGQIPAGIKRIVEELEPEISWEEVLLSYLRTSKNDYTYSRPDRRMFFSDLIFPDMDEEQVVEDLVISFDASGSIDQKELSKFVSEVKNLLKSFGSVKAYCSSFDTKIYGWKEIDKYEVKFPTTGGGGTSTIPIFKEIEKRNINPSVVLIFTDLYAEFPAKEPDYPIIWLATKNHGDPPKWGRKIVFKNNE